MTGWNWLDQPPTPPRWRVILRVALKALILFALCNLIYAVSRPLETLGGVSLYGSAFPLRDRLSRSNDPSDTYSVTTFNLPALFASHQISAPKAADEFRVAFIGDSSVWGSGLTNAETYTARINAADLRTPDGRRIRAYNLGYHAHAALKDVLLLDYAQRYGIDSVVWFVSLETLYRGNQLIQPIVQNNADRVRALIDRHGLALDTGEAMFALPSLLDRTIIGERRALADLLRLQTYGPAWAATGRDDQDHGRANLNDFAASNRWKTFDDPVTLDGDLLTFEILAAGAALAGDGRMLIVNEPLYIGHGQAAALRYNTLYPRWAYDAYRAALADEAASRGWAYLDLWDTVARDQFTDSPFHVTAGAAQHISDAVTTALIDLLQAEERNAVQP